MNIKFNWENESKTIIFNFKWDIAMIISKNNSIENINLVFYDIQEETRKLTDNIKDTILNEYEQLQ